MTTRGYWLLSGMVAIIWSPMEVPAKWALGISLVLLYQTIPILVAAWQYASIPGPTVSSSKKWKRTSIYYLLYMN